KPRSWDQPRGSSESGGDFRKGKPAAKRVSADGFPSGAQRGPKRGPNAPSKPLAERSDRPADDKRQAPRKFSKPAFGEKRPQGPRSGQQKPEFEDRGARPFADRGGERPNDRKFGRSNDSRPDFKGGKRDT